MDQLTFLVVNYYGGRFIDLLFRSIARTLPSAEKYKIVVVNNFCTPYRAATRREKAVRSARYYAGMLLRWRAISSAYKFTPPQGLRVDVVGTTRTPVFWNPTLGIRGKAVSLSHARGLLVGLRRVNPQSRHVMILDQDVVFIARGWLEDFQRRFDDPDTVLVGTFREQKIYPRPFLRPYCLMYRRDFYEPHGDVFLPTPTGDTCSRLTYLCEDGGRRWYCFPNSWSNPDIAAKLGHLGDVASGDGGEPFIVHKGHAPERTADWWDRLITERLAACG